MSACDPWRIKTTFNCKPFGGAPSGICMQMRSKQDLVVAGLKMQQSSMLLASPHTWPCLPFDRLYTIFTTENLNSDFVL